MIEIKEMKEILNELSIERPVFNLEADFQHALAWKIHEKYPECTMRLEKKAKNEDIYYDIFAFNENKKIIIELKYKTKKTDTPIESNGEKFELRNHGAQPLGRYDFIKDISRLEKGIKENNDSVGYAIFITNDSYYYEKPKFNNKNVIDRHFRIHEGNSLIGKLCWKETTSKGTLGGRDKCIILKNNYTLKWENYSKNNFKYLLIKV